MNVDRLLNLPVTLTKVVRQGGEDMFGDPSEVLTSYTFRGWIAQASSDEDTVNRDMQAETFTLYVDRSAAGTIAGSDRVTVEGTTYEVAGPPWSAINPRTGTVSHVVATITRTV